MVVFPDTDRLVPTVRRPAAATRPDALMVPAASVEIVPNDVREEEVTPEAREDPLRVPAGATTADVVTAVTNPFAFTVITGIAVVPPNAPTLELTVARVVAAPILVISPVRFCCVPVPQYTVDPFDFNTSPEFPMVPLATSFPITVLPEIVKFVEIVARPVCAKTPEVVGDI
jgi:hypothetical protein